MQKKLYVGGLPWELDRIGVLNYLKAVLEGNDIVASYELPFVTSPAVHPNAVLRVTDVFVAMDRNTGKSRGFGFITLDFVDAADGEELFEKVISLLDKRIVIGIRGPRELIVNEADEQREDGEGNDRGDRNDRSDENEDSLF